MKARRIPLYFAVACAIYLVTLIATIPAPWVARAVESMSKQRLLLRGPTGSFWAGSGHLYANPQSGARLDLGVLRWSTSWSAMLAGKLATDVGLGEAPKVMRVEISPLGTAVRGLKLELPASILPAFAPALEAFGPGGTLRIRSDELRLDAGSILGDAEIEWGGMRLARAQRLDLGSHFARLRGGGGKVDIELGSIQGPLRLSGGGSWVRGGGLNISGAAEHGAELTAALGPFLSGVCTEYRDRRCVFRLKS